MLQPAVSVFGRCAHETAPHLRLPSAHVIQTLASLTRLSVGIEARMVLPSSLLLPPPPLSWPGLLS